VLPLNGEVSSIVITLATDQADAVMNMPPEEFSRLVRDQFGARLGDMRLLGERHVYPLVAVYADRFIAPRLALLGDAAVGMHPVTAHGFNFGLLGIEGLATRLREARAVGRPIHESSLLASYAREHRRATRPLYLATLLVSKLYADDRLPMRIARKALFGMVRRLPPFQRLVVRTLTDEGGGGRSRLAPQSL
jgi:2-polyprenyl-6-methoxyphenol hydroxylase-like FAD-dependent oxidoreductase